MASSTRRLSTKLRRSEMERALLEVEERYLDHHRALGHSEQTITHYRVSFRLLHKWIEATSREMNTGSLTTSGMEQFSVWLQITPARTHRGNTQRSQYGVFGVMKNLKAFVRFLMDEELLERDVRVKLPKLPQALFPVLTKDELERIWQTPQMTYRGAMGKRNRAIAGLMLDTGIRRGEVTNLSVEDVDLEEQLVVVTGKGSKQRRVPFSTPVKQLLRDRMSAWGETHGSLFGLTDQGVRQLFRRIQVETGIKNFCPHACRHTAATSMVRANMGIHSVKRVLGHSSLVVTERYLSLSDEDLRAKHAAASHFEALVPASGLSAPSKRKRPSRFDWSRFQNVRGRTLGPPSVQHAALTSTVSSRRRVPATASDIAAETSRGRTWAITRLALNFS
jgi:site-specific recombinase XerD